MKRYSYKTLMISSLLTIALLAPMTVSAIANEDKSNAVAEQEHSNDEGAEKRHTHHSKDITQEQWQAMRLKKLQKLATYFNISTEGKTSEQLRVEIEQAKKDNPEKWEVFKQQYHAKKLEKLRHFAKEKGISIEGKTEDQIIKELQKLKENQ